MSYFGWMVDIPTGAQLFYIYCVDCISFYLIVFMLWCEYPVVKSFSCVSHPFSSVDGSHSSGTGFESITYYNSRGEGGDDNQKFFFCERFHDFVTGWKFLKIPHRSCLQKSKATLHEKYDDCPETHSNITWYWFETAPSTGWALKSWSKNRWTTTTIIFNLFDKVIGQQQNSEEIEPGVKSKYGLLFVCFLQQPSQLLHLFARSINKISMGSLPLKSINFS